jgi:hypothetical protein
LALLLRGYSLIHLYRLSRLPPYGLSSFFCFRAAPPNEGCSVRHLSTEIFPSDLILVKHARG